MQHRIFTVALAFLFVLASNAMAASKRKPKGKAGRVHAPVAKPVEAEPAEPAPSAPKTGGLGIAKPNGAPPVETRPLDRPVAKGESVKQESRIEFDERMLKGQSAAGAIYLFQRSPSEWKSIIEVPGTFRPRTVGVLEPDGETK